MYCLFTTRQHDKTSFANNQFISVLVAVDQLEGILLVDIDIYKISHINFKGLFLNFFNPLFVRIVK